MPGLNPRITQEFRQVIDRDETRIQLSTTSLFRCREPLAPHSRADIYPQRSKTRNRGKTNQENALILLQDKYPSSMHNIQVSATPKGKILRHGTKILENSFLEYVNSGLFKNKCRWLMMNNLGYMWDIHIYYF